MYVIIEIKYSLGMCDKVIKLCIEASEKVKWHIKYRFTMRAYK